MLPQLGAQRSAGGRHGAVRLWLHRGHLSQHAAPYLVQVIKYAIDANMIEVLWANDQLHNQQRKGKVLQVRARQVCSRELHGT